MHTWVKKKLETRENRTEFMDSNIIFIAKTSCPSTFSLFSLSV